MIARALEFEDICSMLYYCLGLYIILLISKKESNHYWKLKGFLKEWYSVLCGDIKIYSLIEGFFDDFCSGYGFEQIVEQDIACEHHCNVTNNKNYFTTSYFHHILSLVKKFRVAGFD